jgi:amylosucrase
MGDELAQDNDTTYRADPALADYNRWMHRPYFDDAAAARRHDPATVEGRVFAWIRALVRTRARLRALHAAGESAVLQPDSPHVLAWRRRHPRSGHFVGLVNFSEEPTGVDVRVLTGLGVLETVLASHGPPRVQDGRLWLAGLSFVWLAEE